MSNKVLNGILSLLKKNQEFPNYQAERRIDIFINYFLERILTVYLEKNVEFVCPEFPLKVEVNNKETKQDDLNGKDYIRSTKLDYLCKTDNEVIFVELKTDSNSIGLHQALNYLSTDWTECMRDLKKITNATNTKYKDKYGTLNAAINRLKFASDCLPIRLIYISPLPEKRSEFAKTINILEPKELSTIDILMEEDERIVFEHICNLKFPLHIFEACSV